MKAINCSFVLLGLWHLSMACAKYVCTNGTEAESSGAKIDYIFMIDASNSMCPYIEGLKSGLPKFLDFIQGHDVDASFAIVRFGGPPRLLLESTVYIKVEVAHMIYNL
jgi:hypothetical protein